MPSLSNIAIDASRSSNREKTGTEWYSHQIIKALAEIDDRPYLDLYQRSDTTELAASNVTTRIIERERFWTHFGLSRQMRSRHPNALFVPSHVIPLIHPNASVVTIHDLGYRTFPGAHGLRGQWTLELTTRWNVRAARRIIAISHQTRHDLMLHYGVEPERIHVVYHGLDHGRFQPREVEAVKTKLKALRFDWPYILFVSTLQPRKNVVRLIRAFEQLPNKNLRLVFAGRSGWMIDDIARCIRSSPASARIIRTGHVPDSILPWLYNGAETFVLPSLYEGFGMGVLEAMASGCPVVTSNTSSLPEIAGEAAILVDPESVDDIAQGIASSFSTDKRQVLIERGFKRASEFSWARSAQQTLAAIQRAWEDTLEDN